MVAVARANHQRDEVARLNRVVNDVLDFARPIRFAYAEAEVNDICRSACEAVIAATPRLEIGLDLDPECGVMLTDAERVRSVLVNLLTNARAAVEDRVEDGAPLVVLSSARRANRIVLTVRDRGAGIPDDDVARVFDPYFTTRRTGSGLGLPIAKNVVEGLGGTIGVDSRSGVTEMTVELPDAPVERAVS